MQAIVPLILLPALGMSIAVSRASCCHPGEVVVEVVTDPALDGAGIDSLCVTLVTDYGVTDHYFPIEDALADGVTTFSIRPNGYRGTLGVLVSAGAAGRVVASGAAEGLEVRGGRLVSTTLVLMPVCNPAAFGEPTNLTSLNSTADEWGPALSPDLGTVVFVSDRAGGAGGYDLWMATRSDAAGPFDPPAPVPGMNTAGEEGGPYLSPDGLQLYFQSDRPGGLGGADLWVAARPDVSASWGAPSPLDVLNSPDDESGPSLTADGLEIFFSSDRPGGAGGVDLWLATRAENSLPFSAPVALAELNSASDDGWPSISGDPATLYFDSDRPGGSGGADLYVAERPSRTSPFWPPDPLASLDTADDEFDFWFSRDNARGYFASNRAGGLGAFDLWGAPATCN